ncbi:MAG: MutS-related protein, partial [Acidimicrobiales bacterium]
GLFWGIRSGSPRTTLGGAVAQLDGYVARLRELRQLADELVERMSSEGFKSLFVSIRHDLDDEYLDTLRWHLRQLQFRGGVLLSGRLDRDNSGIDYVLRSPGTRPSRWRERVRLAPRSSYSFTIPPRDEGAANELADLTNRGLNHVANAAAQAADHIESYITMLRAELAFYVGCLNLRMELMERQAPMSLPVPLSSSPPRFSCTDLRDTALVLAPDMSVVGNDTDADDRPLVIVTGANSGGKSTFLRSIGLAQMMLQCGMFVTAASYRSSLHSSIFTHFGREEDASMRSGRLDDELRRMSSIVSAANRYALVLFNESFSGTNEREGSEIGRQIVQALLERDVTVFLVTHQFDFADGFRSSRPSTTRFLRAERAPDGHPSYKLIPADPLTTSFAVDVYHRIGGFADGSRLDDAEALARADRAGSDGLPAERMG